MSLVIIPRIPADEVAPTAEDPGSAKPLAFETISGKRREQFSEHRPDHMYFRVVDEQGNETLLFRDRPDDIKEVTTQLSDRRNREIVFGGSRDDGLVSWKRSVAVCKPGPGTAVNSQQAFAGRADGLTKTCVGMRAHTAVDVAVDTPPVFFRDKVLHLAVVVDPSKNRAQMQQVCEAYYDMKAGLRATIEHEVTGEHTHKEWNVLVPQKDPHYEIARFAVMLAVTLLLKIEREVFVQLPDFDPAKTVEQSTQAHNKKLESMMATMHSQLDGFAAAAQIEVFPAAQQTKSGSSFPASQNGNSVNQSPKPSPRK